jgi:hypothetical protein
MQKNMTVESVRGGIAPSPYAGIGLNGMKAVVSYAGGPIKLTRGGEVIEVKGLTESMRYTIAPPGYLPLRNIHFSLVDVPDLQVIPAENATITDIWMGAGPIPEFLHRVLNVLATLRAFFRLPSFEIFSPIFYRVLNLMKYGEHRGGIFVEASGTFEGKPVTRSWHLLAEGDDGPFIPSMAIEALIRKWYDGTSPESGARPATQVLSLSDYDTLFESRTIYAGMREDTRADVSLYQHLLGSAYDDLPQQVKRLHAGEGTTMWRGQASVKRGSGVFANIMAVLLGFPKSTESTPVTVSFHRGAKGETWQRTFGKYKFSSFQARGKGRNVHLLTERFGVITAALALVIKDESLYLIPRRVSFLGIPMPKLFLPSGESFECETDGVFNFNVTIKVPVLGLIVAYKGWLKAD